MAPTTRSRASQAPGTSQEANAANNVLTPLNRPTSPSRGRGRPRTRDPAASNDTGSSARAARSLSNEPAASPSRSAATARSPSPRQTRSQKNNNPNPNPAATPPPPTTTTKRRGRQASQKGPSSSLDVSDAEVVAKPPATTTKEAVPASPKPLSPVVGEGEHHPHRVMVEAISGVAPLDGTHLAAEVQDADEAFLHSGPSLWDERNNLALLVLLYMIQGVPLGLTFGALPFMLSSKLSYTQVGLFSMAAYPYSLKLLWSPIVDSCFSPRMGRRKSWIVPVQLLAALLLISCAGLIQHLVDTADVGRLTPLFFVFVLLAATQDIAVDGWALTLLSARHVGYASSCQTIGTSAGYFTSFTIFLALQDTQFCNTYIRSLAPLRALGMAPSEQPLVTVASYLTFWGWAFAVITLLVALFKHEVNYSQEELEAAAKAGSPIADPQGALAAASSEPKAPLAARLRSTLSQVGAAYQQLWGVVRLPAVWRLSAFLLSYRVGILAAEGAFQKKLLDKGVAKEALAFLVLFEFPVELLSAVVAGRWATKYTPYPPFIGGYFLRHLLAGLLAVVVFHFPADAISLSEHARWFGLLASVTLTTSFSYTLNFTSIGCFFNQISDPAMGGAYLTLLNTIANMGYILPKTPIFYLIDLFTTAQCVAGPDAMSSDGSVGSSSSAADATGSAGSGVDLGALVCPKKPRDMAGSNPCTDAGGRCEMVQDGFYTVVAGSLVLGVALGFVYVKMLPVLMKLPLDSWRAKAPANSSENQQQEEGTEGRKQKDD